MTETGKDETESDLSALLDSALADFGRTRNTDDELDSMMDTMDQQAAQKAAEKFDDVMRLQRSSNYPGTSSSESIPMTEDERKAAENFQNMLKALVAAEQKALNERLPNESGEDDYDRASAEAFIGQLKASFFHSVAGFNGKFCFENLAESDIIKLFKKLSEQDPLHIADEPQYGTLISLVQAFFSKDLMYPPLKQLLEGFPKYIAEHNELDAELKARYEKQIDIIQRVCIEYEKEESEDVEEMKRRFDTITTLMLELQSYGYPPEELVGEAPPGWVTDPQTGLPKVEDVSKAAETCTVM
uniref:Peroxin-19 n=1 Tax=Setaria digitata TaxID=48799 RepID=A0A915PME8_9BILA